MVNKTQFYKTKVALAVVLSLGLAACGDSEGDAGSVANTQVNADENAIENQTKLTADVTGTVVDSNANPIPGIKVYYNGDLETVTNEGGQYTFKGVSVANVVGVNNEGSETQDSITFVESVITIGGTDEYLGALVTVNVEAQVNNTGGQGNNADGANSQTTIQTFIDGFTASAGVAVLPALNAGAYGYIRDCRTGAPLLDTADVLSLDFVTTTSDLDNSIGNQLTNSEDTQTISSDAEGGFSLTGLAANSEYTVTAKQGWVITTAGANSSKIPSLTVLTGSEGSSELMGTIEVCPVAFVGNDVSEAPFIASIDGQIGNVTVGVVNAGTTQSDFLDDHDNDVNTPDTVAAVDAQYAALNQGVVNNFVINFSEEMASTFDMTEARVKVIVPGSSVSTTVSDATVTLSADGTSAVVTFAEDLAEGTKVDVWFPYWTALDANDDKFLIDNDSILFDSLTTPTTDKATYAHAYFCTFAKPTDVASVLLAPQVFDADTTEDGDSEDLAEYSSAFQDNDAAVELTATSISQLNDGDADAGIRLAALADARGVTVTVDNDYAVVEFDGSNASSIIWTHGTSTVVPGTDAGYEIVQNGAVTELHITPAKHNDVITATPVNGFGDVITAGKVSVTLIDAIAPTTVLQESYNITDATGPRTGEDVVSAGTSNASFGNGGEISAPGTTATAAGEPIIHIQPRHLAGQTSGAADRNEELDPLTSGMSARLTAAEVTALGAAADTVLSVSTIGGYDMPIYDKTAYAAWADVPATIGVAFSEDVTLTTTAPAFDGSTTLSTFAALNDVIADVDGNLVSVDLVTFNTPSVVDLSLDAGADLGFVGSVTDSRGNVSTANTQVFIQDTFPPMMTESVWNGETLELTFNEAPVITTGANITVIDPVNTNNDRTINVTASNTTISGNTMTIELSSADNTALAPLFQNGANNEFAYDDDGVTTNNLPNGEQHALIDWDNISDATGNQWSEFNPTLSVSARGLEAAPVANDTRRWEVVAPRFLAVNAVGVFTYTVATSGYLDADNLNGDDDGTVTYTISFTHPIDVTNANAFSSVIAAHPSYTLPITGAVSASTADANGQALLNGLFTVDIANDGADTFALNTTTVDANNVHASFSLSADHKVVTLTVAGAANTVDSIQHLTTTFGFATTTTSAITGSVTGSGNFNWQNNN